MNLVGERLRQERQRQGLDLKQIAARLCINYRYLNAIEGDDWESLPGGFFSRSFARQYASHLGMDASQFDEALDAVLGTEPAVDFSLLASPKTPINVPPMPSASHRTLDKRMLVSIGALVTVVLGCSGLYAVWQKSQDKRPAAETGIIRPPGGKNHPESRAEFTPKPVIPASTPHSSSAQNDAQRNASQHAVVLPTSTSQSVSGLQVAANEPTWLEVTMNGKTVFSGMLEPGQSRDLQNAEATRILVGNAGGVAMRWNGKDIGPIGPRGQVRRVVFTKESYEIQFPGKPSSD
jgi:cytoskeletal protein RodZ